MRVALVPPYTVLVHQAYTLFWRDGGPREEAYALGVLVSIPFDWYARQLVESHVTVEFVNAAPVPTRDPDDPLRRRVEVVAGRLAAADGRFLPWAQAVGVEVGSLASSESEHLVAELDALVALLYGLDEADVVRIFETFHVGWDYQPRLASVLDHFRRLS